MAPAEGPTATRAECDTHPGRASVGRCDACGRTVCLDCPLRWSLLAALAAAVGGLVWAASWLRRRWYRRWLRRSLPLLGMAVAAGSALHVWHPPYATEPWLGPWVTLGGSALILAGAAVRAAEERPPRRAPS
ncbi:MAG: hypothetical protein LC722_03270 [Actinobacteria bacterium]|nr:hypothetical protein [Actinomycetota bacterium]